MKAICSLSSVNTLINAAPSQPGMQPRVISYRDTINAQKCKDIRSTPLIRPLEGALAPSVKDAEIVLKHLSTMGFRINMMKSSLEPSQQTEYLGFSIGSLLSSHTDRGKDCIFHTMYHPLLDGESGAIMNVLTDAGSYGLSNVVHLSLLRNWKSLTIFRTWIPLGAVSLRVSMTTDVSLKGLGATLMGRSVNCMWPDVVNTQFPLSDESASLGVDALAHQRPNVLLYPFPPLNLISPTLPRVREQGLSLIQVFDICDIDIDDQLFVSWATPHKGKP